MSDLLSTRRLTRLNPAGILTISENAKCLDTAQLDKFEKSFRQWVDRTIRSDVRISRKRIFLIFMLIRYTGARFNEILSLNARKDIDVKNNIVRIGRTEGKGKPELRDVHIPLDLANEINKVLNDPEFSGFLSSFFKIDPGHVRRKFYERAQECGFPKEYGNPNAIRRARAIELLRSNIPTMIVQKLLGLSTPGLTTSLLKFSNEDMRRITQYYVDKESRRKTSARNTFFCKIMHIRKGDIQAEVEMMTLGGYSLFAVITNESLRRLQLKPDSFIMAEIKAPWLILSKGDTEPESSAENRLKGTVSIVIRGKITTEYIVSLPDGTELCSVVTEESRRRLGLKEGDIAWVLFNSFSIILNVD
ncbi:MAG: transporter [Desulfobacterales bacterium PC51MH44]|nr:MAG: transporter [Desulfobacterales bacterium PC51MH44]